MTMQIGDSTEGLMLQDRKEKNLKSLFPVLKIAKAITLWKLQVTGGDYREFP